jgi:RHS repeat-associated protein
MNRLRTTPIVAAALALAACILLASAGPATGQVPPILDTFNRANEDPLSGGGNWARAQQNTWFDMRIVGSVATHSASGSSMSYWTQQSFPGGAGSVWGKYGNTDQGGGNRASLLLIKDVGGTSSIDGYELAREVFGLGQNDAYFLYRITNGARVSPAIAATAQNPVSASWPYFNLRRIGNTVEAWASPDNVIWTMILSVADTVHTTGTYHPAIHALSAGIWIDDFGAAASGAPGGATLTVVKNVVNDNGGSAVPANWTMNVAGPTPLSFPGASAGTTNTVQPGTYTVTESGGPAGYSLSYSGDCAPNGQVTIAAGETKTCTLTNNDQAAPPSGSPAGRSNGITGCGRGSLTLTATCTVADPVNTFTGFFVHQEQDLSTPGTGVPFEWARSYTSGDATVGPLGPGWTHTYAASLAVQGNGDVLARGEEGQEVYFTKQANGSFVGAAGARAALTTVAGGYELRRTDQVVYAFNSQGRLLSIKDRNAQGVTLGYDGQGRLATVTDAANRQTTVSYNASNLVSQVSTVGGRSVSYGYTSGRLTLFTDVRGKNWTYTYDAGGRLATIVDPLTHPQVMNVYGPDGRVTSQTDAVNKTTTFAWDAGSELATVTDANDKVWKHDYTDGVLAKEIDPLNNETQLGHDADLNETAVTSPTSQQTTMTYDAAGNLLTATAPPSLGNAQKTFVYNGRNDPTQVTDARNKVTGYTYTPAGNVETVTQDGIQVAAYTYDPAGRVLTLTDGNEKTTTYTYFPATGYLESVTDPLGNKTTYTYDSAGRVATRVDPKGNVAGCGCAAQFTSTYTYNTASQQLTETDPLGHTTTNVYDDAGRLTSTINANGRTTSYTYDDANRVLTETTPDPDGGGPLAAPVTTYTYDDVGNRLTETDPRGNTTTFAYNDASQLISETGPDPDGGGPLAAPVTTYTHDANANLASTVEPRGNAAGANPNDFRTTYTYDAAGRQLTETRPDPDGGGPATSPVTTNVYDPVGSLQSVTDGNSHTTSYTHDAAGRILTVTAPDLGVTTYAYDDAGNVLTREDAKQHTTTYAYDSASRLISETSPDPDGPGPQGPAVTTYTYDPNGNRLTMTDPNGNATGTAGDGVTTYGYDRANRVTSINYSDSTPDATFTYDAVGNRLTMVDGSGTETRTYDNLDRLLTVTRGSNAFSYAYDAAGNVTSRGYPGGVTTAYTYDNLNRMNTLSQAGQTVSLFHDPAGNLTSVTYPTLSTGAVFGESRLYDRAGRLTSVATATSRDVPCGPVVCFETTVLSRYSSTLDPAGNPTQIERYSDVPSSTTSTRTFTYDANDRITAVCFQVGTCPNPSDPFVRWTYDKVGNRLTEQRPSGTTTYSYDTRDRLLSAGSTNYTYNQNGNELSAGSRTFTYDLANRLKTTTQGNTTTTYAYDGDGVRLQASTGSQANKKTNFLWDVNGGLPQVAVERNGNNSVLRTYLYGPRRLAMLVGSNRFYYDVDGLGSVSELVTSSAAVPQWTYSYDPFGAIKTETKNAGSAPDNFMKFTGEYLDPTGLYHLRARQYDPSVGRFLGVDPVARSAGTPFVTDYAYADCRPTVFVDPTGEFRGVPNRTGVESAGLAASRLQYTFVVLEKTKGPAFPCFQSISAQLDRIAFSGQLRVITRFLNLRKTARGSTGSLFIASTQSSQREAHSYAVSSEMKRNRRTLWTDIPALGQFPQSVVITFVGDAPPDPRRAVNPSDDDAYGRVAVTMRHQFSGKRLDCAYAGRFGRR